jgi:hypothetical protein
MVSGIPTVHRPVRIDGCPVNAATRPAVQQARALQSVDRTGGRRPEEALTSSPLSLSRPRVDQPGQV